MTGKRAHPSRKVEQATKRALAELNQIFETAADGMRVLFWA